MLWGKLAALDMTSLGWLDRKTSTQTNKQANSADPDQIASVSLRSSLIRVYTVCFSTKYIKKELYENQNSGTRNME